MKIVALINKIIEYILKIIKKAGVLIIIPYTNFHLRNQKSKSLQRRGLRFLGKLYVMAIGKFLSQKQPDCIDLCAYQTRALYSFILYTLKCSVPNYMRVVPSQMNRQLKVYCSSCLARNPGYSYSCYAPTLKVLQCLLDC